MKLKHLIEEHLFKGRALTIQEYNKLLPSKYGRLIDSSRVQSKFNMVMERTMGSSLDVPKIRKPFSLVSGIDRITIRELVDTIEDTFNADISTGLAGRFQDVTGDELSAVIEEFITNNVMDSDTRSYLYSIMESDDPQKILYKLYIAE